MQTVAIVGAGIAGVTACRSLRESGFSGSIILFGDEAQEPYDRPSLSKSTLKTGGAPPPLAKPGWEQEYDVEMRLGERVISVDFHAKSLVLDRQRSVTFDKLVLAAGARARSLAAARSAPPGTVHVLRTLADSAALREELGAGRRVIIIGGGLIGCELATTVRTMGCEVVLLESADELLLRVLGRKMGAWCRDRLTGLGVEIHLGVSVTSISADAGVRDVRCSSGRRFAGDVAIVCVGAEPSVELARGAGLACNRGVLVDACGRTDNPAVFAIGDAASWPLRDGGQRSLETYLNSQSQAICAASSIVGQAKPAPQIPISWTEIAGSHIQMMGDVEGPGAIVERKSPEGDANMYLRLHNGVIQAAISIDRAKDFAFVTKLIEREFEVDSNMVADGATGMRDVFKAASRADVKC